MKRRHADSTDNDSIGFSKLLSRHSGMKPLNTSASPLSSPLSLYFTLLYVSLHNQICPENIIKRESHASFMESSFYLSSSHIRLPFLPAFQFWFHTFCGFSLIPLRQDRWLGLFQTASSCLVRVRARAPLQRPRRLPSARRRRGTLSPATLFVYTKPVRDQTIQLLKLSPEDVDICVCDVALRRSKVQLRNQSICAGVCPELRQHWRDCRTLTACTVYSGGEI